MLQTVFDLNLRIGQHKKHEREKKKGTNRLLIRSNFHIRYALTNCYYLNSLNLWVVCALIRALNWFQESFSHKVPDIGVTLISLL